MMFGMNVFCGFLLMNGVCLFMYVKVNKVFGEIFFSFVLMAFRKFFFVLCMFLCVFE